MTLRQFAMLLLLAALWGASFLFIRMAAPVIGPLLTIEGRVSLAAFSLMLFALLRRKALKLGLYWRELLMMGLLNAAIPFSLIARAQLHLSASFASILNATTPLFAALIASVWLKERLSLKRFLGLMLGVLGVSVLVGWGPISITKAYLLAIAYMLLATFFYGLAGVYARLKLTNVPTLSSATGQQLAASLWLLFPLMFDLPRRIPPLNVALAVLALALLCTALAYLLYFSLIREVGPTKTLTVTYLIPFFGTTWGLVFLHESFSLGMLLGLCIILTSVLLVTELNLKTLIKAWG
ncbi:MAG: DMT family transporter [Trueperaceae bacterium]|nr:DMT family transporter [Trueperaceae bacterium]